MNTPTERRNFIFKKLATSFIEIAKTDKSIKWDKDAPEIRSQQGRLDNAICGFIAGDMGLETVKTEYSKFVEMHRG